MSIPSGFILPLVLVLVLAAALLTGEALRGATVEQALVTAARARQRAFEAAEFGLAQAESRLRSGAPVLADARIPLPTEAASQVHVATELLIADPLPAGFSANRAIALRYRIRSFGESGGARISLEAGLTRLEPAP